VTTPLAQRRTGGRRVSTTALVLVTGVSPFATDTYIAALPQVQRTLQTTASAAQLTMTAFIIGLAVGQLVCGPASDATGRRTLLLASSATFAGLSFLCALAPSIGVLIALRAGEGIAGGCGVAVGRAVVSDRWSGVDAAHRYGTLASITLLAPIIAPAIGGGLLLIGDWRGVFVFLGGLGLLMSAAAVLGLPETLPPEARHPPGLGATVRRMGGLLRNRGFAATVGVQCLATAGFFTYIGGSSFVLQGDLHLSAARYSLLFVTNAAAMAILSATFRALVRRAGAVRLRAAGISLSTAAIVALAAYAHAAGHAALAPTWTLLAITVAGMGLTIPSTTAIAQEIGRASGGTASALQGGLTFTVGAVATALTGLTGQTTVAGMTTIMAVLYVAALVTALTLGRAPFRYEAALSR
jgi:DHA1 family bicyclomycin/chloramphenicol resistance-like MFS transporter